MHAIKLDRIFTYVHLRGRDAEREKEWELRRQKLEMPEGKKRNT